MKQNLRLTVSVVMILLLSCLMVAFTSCYSEPPTIIDPVEDTTTTEETFVTQPTIPVPENQMTVDNLVAVQSAKMKWSDLEPYTHEMTGDNTARFMVSNKYGKEATLDVTIDFENDVLTGATFSYGDISEDILTDSILGLTRVIQALGTGA